MAELLDLDHYFGGGLAVSASGDFASVSGLVRSQQHILRRLLTNPGTYLWHPEYGGGLGQFIGSTASPAVIVSKIRAQLLLEPAVLQNPAPVISIQQLPDALVVSIKYTDEGRTPQILGFTVTP